MRASKYFAIQPRTIINAEVNVAQVHAGAGIIFAALLALGNEFAKIIQSIVKQRPKTRFSKFM